LDASNGYSSLTGLRLFHPNATAATASNVSYTAPYAGPQALSVYGYSLTPFLGAAPVCLFSWPLRSAGLATASLVAAIFVLRSAWPRLQEHMPEKSMVLLLAAVATYHVLWFLLLTAV